MIDKDENNSLKFKLEVYEGPLDLLLKLIAKNKVSIYDIPISLIFEQYMEYIDAMQDMDMDLAGEFINMAVELMLIKSKMLLPRSEQSAAEDPREDLAARLIAYKRAKEASGMLLKMYETYGGRMAKETDDISPDKSFVANHEIEAIKKAMERIAVRQKIMAESMNENIESNLNTIVVKKITPIEVKVVSILRTLKKDGPTDFETIIMQSKTRSDIIATFVATLQLISKHLIFICGENLNNMPILEINYDRSKEEYRDSGGDGAE